MPKSRRASPLSALRVRACGRVTLDARAVSIEGASRAWYDRCVPASRLARIDYAVTSLVLTDDTAALPTPGHAPARLTDEGYLLADALLARDGLLEYGDGKETWYEYRPRPELAAARATWAAKPITDKHPAKMVDSKTWAKVARGVHVSVPEVVDVDGVAYLRAKILITDADVVERAQKFADAGKPVQLSIGFTSVVIPREGDFAGTPYKYVQTELIGNHTAIVDEGRAGPVCRVLLDGADVPVSAPAEIVWYDHVDVAEKVLTPNAKPGSATAAKPKTDEAGAPDEMVEVPAPDGQPTQLPAWAAAAISKLRALEGGQPMPAPAAPSPTPPGAPPAPPAPMANAMQAQPPAPPASPAPPPEKPEDRKESLGELIVARRKLERLAERVGVDASKLDESDEDLKRAVIAKRMPHAKVDKLDGAALDAFVDTIAAEPAQPSKPAAKPSPWRLDETADKPAAKVDSANKAVAEYLATQGYGG